MKLRVHGILVRHPVICCQHRLEVALVEIFICFLFEGWRGTLGQATLPRLVRQVVRLERAVVLGITMNLRMHHGRRIRCHKI